MVVMAQARAAEQWSARTIFPVVIRRCSELRLSSSKICPAHTVEGLVHVSSLKD